MARYTRTIATSTATAVAEVITDLSVWHVVIIVLVTLINAGVRIAIALIKYDGAISNAVAQRFLVLPKRRQR